MNKIHNVLVCGGDARQLYAAQALIKNGINVVVKGFEQAGQSELFAQADTDIRRAVSMADAVMLPLPVSRDDVHLNAPLAETKFFLNDIADSAKIGQPFYCGMISAPYTAALQKAGARVFDYFQREELIVANAVPTAEGVLKIALEATPGVLNRSRIAVTGFGRTARVIAHVLIGVGAQVTIFARKYADIESAKAMGCSAYQFENFMDLAPQFSLVINTVPAPVLREAELSRLNPECPVIEIASSPGIDLPSAKRHGIRVISAMSLPGKVAPKAAGEIISDTVINMMKEEYA